MTSVGCKNQNQLECNGKAQEETVVETEAPHRDHLGFGFSVVV